MQSKSGQHEIQFDDVIKKNRWSNFCLSVCWMVLSINHKLAKNLHL